MKYLTFKQKIKTLPVFSTGLLSSLDEDINLLKVQLSSWKKKGLIVRLRKGLYVLREEERGIQLSLNYLANQIFIPSYISLESALAFYGLIPEFIAQITSITTRKTCRFQNEFGLFSYQHLKPGCYTGFTLLKDENGFNVLISEPEKAIVDFLYLNLSKFNVKDRSSFVGSYRFQNCNKLSKNKIKKFAALFKVDKLKIICNIFIEEMMK